MSLNKSKITADMMRNAKPGDALRDATGRDWIVERNLAPKGPSYPSVMTRLPGYGQEKLTCDPHLGIVDDEYGTVVELNNPNAQFIPATN